MMPQRDFMKPFLTVVLVLSCVPAARSAVIKWEPFPIPSQARSVRPPLADPVLELERAIQIQDIARDLPAARLAFARLRSNPSVPEEIRKEATRRLTLLNSQNPAPASGSRKSPATANPDKDSDSAINFDRSGLAPFTVDINIAPEVNQIHGTLNLWADVQPPVPSIGSWQMPGSRQWLTRAGDRQKPIAAPILANPSEKPETASRTPAPEPDLRNLSAALVEIQKLALTDISSADLMQAAFEGMARRLHPEAIFIPASSQAEGSEKPLIGVGMILSFGEEITCQAVVAGSPADRAGLLPGCMVLKVDGKTPFALGGTLEKVVRAVRGPEGSTVNLDIRFPDGTEKNITITRALIPLHPPALCLPLKRNSDGNPKWVIEPGILAVKINAMVPGTADELLKLIQDPAHQPLKAFILDLRENGGGSTQEGQEILKLLVPKTTFPVCMRKDRQGTSTVFPSPWSGTPSPLPAMPMAVLTGPGTAKMAEVVAAALQDQHCAQIIGGRTLGRSVIFTMVPVPGGAIQVPVAELCRASGGNIERKPGMTEADAWGVIPDIKVPESEGPAFVPRFTKVLEEPKLKEIPVPAEFGNTHPLYAEDNSGKTPETTPPAQPQWHPAGSLQTDPVMLRALQSIHEQLGQK